MMKHTGASQAGESASQLISKRISELGDWRGDTLGRIRALIKEADPDVIEEWKWMGTPVWSHSGIICTGETYKSVVKMTFAKGAFLNDPSRLFNSSLEGNMRRAIDIHEGEDIDAPALKALISAAVALNVSGKKAAPSKTAAPSRTAAPFRTAAPPKKAAAAKNAAPAKNAAAARTAAPPKKAAVAKNAALPKPTRSVAKKPARAR